MSGNLIDNHLTSRKTQARPCGSTGMRPSFNAGNIPPIKADSVEFLGMYTDLKCINSNCTQFILEGKINDQNSFIKTVRLYGPSNEEIEGYIGNKKIQLNSLVNESESDNISKTYVGTFNNKNINLTIEHDCTPDNDGWFKSYFKKNVIKLPNNVSIKGTIDNKPYEINLPHAKIPRDSDEKDLVTLLLKNESLEISTIKNEIVGFQPDENRWEEYIKKGNNKTQINKFLAGVGTAVLGTAIGKVVLERVVDASWPKGSTRKLLNNIWSSITKFIKP